ncbi:GNAT family N-acetyltransferase, partial [Candidatus Bipolaricaulota bacterium]|nr:GNAT family N-acetyltransferase [Candidatus Bipolaricaulota bacterium]
MFDYRVVADLSAVEQLAKSAFSIRRPEHPAVMEWLEQSVQDGRKLYGVYEDERLLSVYMLYDFRMRLRNSVVPMGGIGLLCSRLDARGKGAVRFMIERGLETMREAGHVVSVLDPFDQSFYRKYGWELFERLQRIETSPGSIEVPEDGLDHEVIDLPRADGAVISFYNDYACAHNTLVQRDDVGWARRTSILPWNSNTAARGVVRVSREGCVVGLIGYDLSRKADEWDPTLVANLFIYEDEAAKREMLRYLGRLSHQVKTLRIELPVDEDLWPYFPNGMGKRSEHDFFMIRTVSMNALDGLAVDAEDVSFAVEIGDEQAPWNAGRWQVTIDKGVLRVEPTDGADLRCGIGV